MEGVLDRCVRARVSNMRPAKSVYAARIDHKIKKGIKNLLKSCDFYAVNGQKLALKAN